MMLRRFGALVLAAGLMAACGSEGDKKKTGSGDGSDGHDSAVVTGHDAGDEQDDASAGGTTRKVIRDAPNCPFDNPKTPGTECPGVVACGGTPAKPEACPLETHSCCVSGIPKDSTVNCYKGTDACEGAEVSTPCDGPEDCKAGEYCCVDPPGASVTTTCRPEAECSDASQGTVLCHRTEDCPLGLECKSLDHSAWWGYCS